jgi:hypothetical protein
VTPSHLPRASSLRRYPRQNTLAPGKSDVVQVTRKKASYGGSGVSTATFGGK